MGVRMSVVYEGDLHYNAEHGPSKDRIMTDAPVDNRGRGEHFSPTDLVGAALGTCTLTVMAIAARDHGFVIDGARADVEKEMGAVPRRHIARLRVRIELPARLDEHQRALMEATARTCPVAASLGPETAVDVTFDYV